jgi:hypothetical protein
MKLSQKGTFAPPPRLPKHAQAVLAALSEWPDVRPRTHWRLGDESIVALTFTLVITSSATSTSKAKRILPCHARYGMHSLPRGAPKHSSGAKTSSSTRLRKQAMSRRRRFYSKLHMTA